MKKNVGTTDRIVRLLAAVVFIVLYVSGTVTGTFGLILMIAAVIFALTSLVSFCPLYALFGMNTCPVEKKA
jgi:hypothetical protein